MLRSALAAGLAALAGAAAAAPQLPQAPTCPVFPASSPWNRPVDRLPAAANSATLIRSIGLTASLHADFGSGTWDGSPIGIPYNVVSGRQRKAKVSFRYADESDKGPYPIPAHPKIEGGSDRHLLIVDRDACRLYELFAAQRRGASWTAGSGAIWSLRSNALRPATWTSADAAGLPILPGLARYDEVAAGAIRHALRFTAARTRRAYVYPARHYASDSSDPSLPPMGLRVRLKAGFDTSGFPPQARIVLEALKRYGMILADNGSPWFVSGAPDPRWSNDQLHTLARVTGADFEVVDASSLRPWTLHRMRDLSRARRAGAGEPAPAVRFPFRSPVGRWASRHLPRRHPSECLQPRADPGSLAAGSDGATVTAGPPAPFPSCNPERRSTWR